MPKKNLNGFIVDDDEEEHDKSFSGSDEAESEAVTSEAEESDEPSDKPKKKRKAEKKEKKKQKKVKVEKEEDEGESSAITAEKNEQGEQFFSLGGTRRLTIRKWNNKQLIDIREFWKAPDGTEKPGKKGISLSVEQWTSLAGMVDQVNSLLGK